MVATLGGLLALPLGLAVLLLPLLATELSRPRDSAWGALVLLLGLVLVTSADRLSGAPMLGVICTALLLGRLGVEVGQGRWRQLSEEEKQRLGSLERWQTSFSQLGATISGGAGQLGSLIAGLGERFGQGLGSSGALGAAKAGGRSKGKRWVRPETQAVPQESRAASADAPQEAGRANAPEEPTVAPDPADHQPAAEPTGASDSPSATAPSAAAAMASSESEAAPETATAAGSEAAAAPPAGSGSGSDPESQESSGRPRGGEAEAAAGRTG
ncbi:MAG: Ycf66 family protein [Cyanobium sp.]